MMLREAEERATNPLLSLRGLVAPTSTGSITAFHVTNTWRQHIPAPRDTYLRGAAALESSLLHLKC